MDDIISRQAAIDALVKAIREDPYYDSDGAGLSVCDVRVILNELPSAQPEQKTGKWLWADGVRCSVCNHKLQSTGLPSYCPKCGVKMRGE